MFGYNLPDAEKIKVIKDALEDWKANVLTDWQLCDIVYQIINPAIITEKDIEWAKKKLKELRLDK